MKRILVAITLLNLNAAAVLAQEPPENELDLVRQLNAKGWSDLAKKRIETLLKQKDPVLAAALPLELARINIHSAQQLPPEQRIPLFTEAHAQLQDYIKKNQGKPAAALASVELARLTSYHAQALLAQALGEDTNEKRHEKARPAEIKFIEAGKELDAAVKLLDQAAKNSANSAFKKTLDKELEHARLEQAINYFDQGRTYINKSKEAINAARSTAIDKARKMFVALAKDDKSEAGNLANAWVMKCAIELTDPDNAAKYYSLLMKKADDPIAKPAVRLAKYFYIQDITLPRADVETIGTNIVTPKGKKTAKTPQPTPIEQLHKVQQECEAWLKAYGVKRTYEGEGVLFEYAVAYYMEAQMLEGKADKAKKVAAKDDKGRLAALKKAEDKFEQLAKLDGDLAERARDMSARIKRATLPATGDLRTFTEYVMRAMIERDAVRELSNKLDDAKPDDVKKLEDERKKKLKEVIDALNKGLSLATAADPVSKIDDARYFLSGAYLSYGDPYRAAVVAEALARGKPATRRSPEGAATALATYASLQSRKPDDIVLRSRLQDLANFILAPENKAWSHEAAASLAHYHLAMLDKKDNKFKSAIQHLEKISPTFTDYIYTQGQLVFIAEDARLNTEDEKEKAWYVKAAREAIGRMPKFNLKEDSPSVIIMYFFAKIEESKFLYAEAGEKMTPAGELQAVKKCEEMAKYLQALRTEFAAVKPGAITPKSYEQIEFTLHVMLKYADLGVAEACFRGGSNDRFDKVLKATDAVVKEMLDVAGKGKPGDPIVKKDNAVVGKILGLALRASVQKGDVKRGMAILDVLQRLKGTEGNDAGASNVVSDLLRDIALQIKTMTDSGDANLEKTKSSYIGFLDAIADSYKKDKGIDNNNASMLAHAYMSLHVPCKAAENFAKVKAPKDLDKKIVKPKVEKDEDVAARQKMEEELSRYWATQLEYVRALRGCKDTESLKKAAAVIDVIEKHPNARFKLQASMEKNHLMGDLQKYRDEFVGWKTVMNNPSITQRMSDKDVQKIYFTAYFYNARALYKVAVLDKDLKQDRSKLITSSVNALLKLENTKGQDGWKMIYPLFQDFLKEKDAEQFKKEYDRLKAAQKSAALGVPAADGLAFASATPQVAFTRRTCS